VKRGGVDPGEQLRSRLLTNFFAEGRFKPAGAKKAARGWGGLESKRVEVNALHLGR
jgi:hypothetical protein